MYKREDYQNSKFNFYQANDVKSYWESEIGAQPRMPVQHQISYQPLLTIISYQFFDNYRGRKDKKNLCKKPKKYLKIPRLVNNQPLKRLRRFKIRFC